MQQNNPGTDFYFTLALSDTDNETEASFEEVSGISMEVGIAVTSKNPTEKKYTNLILKRGMLNNNLMSDWCSSCLSATLSTPIVRRNLLVSLKNKSGVSLAKWTFKNAWPVRWNVTDLPNKENMIIVDSLEFAYTTYEKTA